MDTRTLNVPGGTLTYDRHGTTGRPLVCVPGIGDLRSSFRTFVPRMVDAGFVVHVLDLRGHGDSTADFDTYSCADIAGDVVALLEAEDLRDAVIVGNSIGGGATCRAAVLAPDRVSEVVLINPFVRDMPADRWMRPMVPLMFARPWGAWAWQQYRKTLIKTVPEDQAEHEARIHANLSEPPRLAAMRAMLRASKADIHARLGELAIPSLVVMGAEDPDYSDPEAEGAALVEMLGGPTELALIDQTGHYPQVERPDETAALVRAFLSQAVRRGA